jgi:hypothetical protein
MRETGRLVHITRSGMRVPAGHSRANERDRTPCLHKETGRLVHITRSGMRVPAGHSSGKMVRHPASPCPSTAPHAHCGYFRDNRNALELTRKRKRKVAYLCSFFWGSRNYPYIFHNWGDGWQRIGQRKVAQEDRWQSKEMGGQVGKWWAK